MEQIEIREAGLLLRPWQQEDAEYFVTSQNHQAWAHYTAAPFGVFDPVTGELLGSCGFVQLQRGPDRDAWTGARLSTDPDAPTAISADQATGAAQGETA